MNGNENSKTIWFLAAAVLVVAVAWFSRPVAAVKDESAVLGTKMFPGFKDPGDVDYLEVLQYDQTKSDAVRLEVAKTKGLWTIPSHGGYPADAKTHLAVAANALIDLTINGMAPGFAPGSPPMDPAALRKAQNDCGVVDPDPHTVKSSDVGVGTRMTMKNSDGHELASVIIGKTLPDQPGQCYMRKAGKDPVYVVTFDPAAVSVHFADWIEPDLLKFNPIDLKGVEIKDYTFAIKVEPAAKGSNELVAVPLKTFKGEYVLDAPTGDKPWKLVQNLGMNAAKDKLVPVPLAANEELNVTSLDALKTALEDLKIVDVKPKPSAVPADLRVRAIDDQTKEDLFEKGFCVLPVTDDPNGPQEVFSDSGDISLQMTDGVRYVLRFGKTTGESSAAAKAKKKGDAKSGKDDKSKEDTVPGLDRYLFVATEFNQDAVAKPALAKMPEEKPAEKAPERKVDAKTAEGDKKIDVKKDDPKKADSKKDDTPKSADAKKEEAKKDQPAKESPAKVEVKKDPVKEAADAAALAAQRAQVEKDNKRLQEEYDTRVVAGKMHAKTLSDRFAQWYYVIPADTYAKIHLDRKDIVKVKEPPKDAVHDHDHEHEHGGFDTLPSSPAGTLEKLKQDAPAGPETK